MNKEEKKSDKAPTPIGAYSQAIKHSNLVFLSGQIPIDPKTMQLVSEDINIQTKQVFKNIFSLIEEAGGSLEQIVKLTIYLKDLDHFSHINLFMEEVFSKPFPARTVIEVSNLPKKSLIEVDVIMIL